MCGRYYVEMTDAELAEVEQILKEISKKHTQLEPEQIQLDIPGQSTLGIGIRTGEIFPTNLAPIRLRNRMEIMKWGFPHFKGSGVIINAVSETVKEKPFFKSSYHNRRCLIPATHYFEWEKTKTAR